MSELKPRITENGIDYILVGDYYIPDLKAGRKENTAPWKVWTDAPGIFKRSPPSQIEHISTRRRIVDISCRPEQTGTERLDTIMEQMKATEGVTEELKRTDQMEWVQRCNNIHNRAEEIVLHEMIYS